MGMLNKNPLSRWSMKDIRDSEWFRKKHPIIKEDLARLPTDVVNNECGSTFRMINYLEKYCQGLQEQHQQMSTTHSNAQTIQSQYENANQEMPVDYTQQEAAAVPTVDTQSKTPNGNTLNSHQTASQFSQATKMKKNHCRLM